MHDARAIASLMKPELIQGRLGEVEIETGAESNSGMTMVDGWSVTDRLKTL